MDQPLLSLRNSALPPHVLPGNAHGSKEKKRKVGEMIKPQKHRQKHWTKIESQKLRLRTKGVGDLGQNKFIKFKSKSTSFPWSFRKVFIKSLLRPENWSRACSVWDLSLSRVFFWMVYCFQFTKHCHVECLIDLSQQATILCHCDKEAASFHRRRNRKPTALIRREQKIIPILSLL